MISESQRKLPNENDKWESVKERQGGGPRRTTSMAWKMLWTSISLKSLTTAHTLPCYIVRVCRHAQNRTKNNNPADLCNIRLHPYTAAQLYIIFVVWEGAVCLWPAFQTSSLHKITSWEDNLCACDNLFKLTFVQTVKASELVEGKCKRPMSVSWFPLPGDNQSTVSATTHRNCKAHVANFICFSTFDTWFMVFYFYAKSCVIKYPTDCLTLYPLSWWGYHDVKLVFRRSAQT